MFNSLWRWSACLALLTLALPCGWPQHRPTPTPTPIPDNIVQQVQRANEMFRQGQHDAAIALYRVALQQAPTFPEGHYRLGVALAANGQFLEAEESFKAALELDPNFTAAQNMLEKYAQDIQAARRTPTPTPAAPPPAAPGAAVDASSEARIAAAVPQLTEKEQRLVDELRAMPPASQKMVLWLLDWGFWAALLLEILVALAVGAVLGALFWLIGKSRGHAYSWCWAYGTFCCCLGFILVFLPPKVGRIIVGIMFVLCIISTIFSFTNYMSLDVDLVRRALENAPVQPLP